ncbi:thioredoxin-like 3-3 [Impatiens glandulifera]|uniref:thioredoxin-like 3-3 n=1 Tax=Impatiens glandulifera TaxID=253017 RepID=UPI001FB1319A|nr:thioredoxin-like 3-3 [Impatiens glandulifera]
MKVNRLKEEEEEEAKGPVSVSLNNNNNNNLSENRLLTIATDDKHLTDIFHNIKASKTPAVINYGASWCQVCSQILPSFSELSKKFSKLSFVYADIDQCPETTQHIRYTPSFHFYSRDGERVDEMIGAGVERLHDRLWLHSS